MKTIKNKNASQTLTVENAVMQYKRNPRMYAYMKYMCDRYRQTLIRGIPCTGHSALRGTKSQRLNSPLFWSIDPFITKQFKGKKRIFINEPHTNRPSCHLHVSTGSQISWDLNSIDKYIIFRTSQQHVRRVYQYLYLWFQSILQIITS